MFYFAGRLFSGNDIAAPYGAGGGMFPPRVGVQVSKDRAAQAARSVPFPRRLGVHVNDYSAAPAAGDGLFHGSTGIKGADCHVAYGAECGQYTKEIGVQMATTGTNSYLHQALLVCVDRKHLIYSSKLESISLSLLGFSSRLRIQNW